MTETVIPTAAKTFEDRRKADPQAVIDDLLGQVTRQATEIHKLMKKPEFNNWERQYLLELLEKRTPNSEDGSEAAIVNLIEKLSPSKKKKKNA